jgi:hypothetical protein
VDFESAVTVGLAKASLAIAKRKADDKENKDQAEDKKNFDELKKRMVRELNKLYQTISGKDIKITKTTLLNMISPNPVQRLGRALDLVIPPLVRDAGRYLAELQEIVHLYQRNL